MDYKNIISIPPAEILDQILLLHQTIFEGSSFLVKEMKRKPELLVTVACRESKVVGYKIGYELDSTKFYSWLGGVDEKYRNQGIASQLMRIQHEYVCQRGYPVIQTKTKNRWRAMLILNIKHGFDIIGTYTDKEGEPKIILEKQLFSNPHHVTP